MLTSDTIYKRPLLPVITIKNTANTSTLYSYSSFTGTATGVTTVFPLYCSVSLSQNTHGEFTIQFEDQSEDLEDAGVTVGSRVIIECGKQSGSITRLISGLVRKKGYSRGADNKLLYTISGASTGIRLNEHIVYINSEAARTITGQLDFTDATRKADSLMSLALGALTADGILDKSSLAVNSDVETFIPSLQVEFGEMQDAVNYIEDQSGGELVIDTNDDVNFRYEIKNTLFGRGFTLKNKYTAAATGDDADDTMYLVHKNWTYEDSFYKSDAYANRLFALLPADDFDFSDALSMGYTTTYEGNGRFNSDGAAAGATHEEWGLKFRPSHSHYLSGDFIFLLRLVRVLNPPPDSHPIFRIILDSGGVPLNTGGTVATLAFIDSNFVGNTEDPCGPTVSSDYRILVGGAEVEELNLSTALDYWMVLTDDNAGYDATDATGYWTQWMTNTVGRTGFVAHRTAASGSATTDTNGGTGWSVSTDTRPCFEQPIRRSQEFRIWDPKAVMAVSSGLTGGQFVSTTLSDISPLVKTKDSMYRYLAQQIYNMARPRTSYSFPSVTAPNIPPFPGDPIIISDSVLGFSTAGNQIVQTVCGDMTYTWGAMDAGNYEAPTILSINAIGVHPRYR